MDNSNGGVDTIIQLGAGTAFSSLDGSQMMGFDKTMKFMYSLLRMMELIMEPSLNLIMLWY